MKLRANFHFHTADDPHDRIAYSTKEGIDAAARRGLSVLALTLHEKAGWTKEYDEYAREKGVTLISGIEKDIGEPGSLRKGHTLILNCGTDAEQVHTFADLARYRHAHPDIFVVAAHPFHPGPICHKHNLERYIHLFDAIEHSWFFSRAWNPNIRAGAIARRYQKPFIATSDTHFFDFLGTDYAVVDAPKKTARDIIAALRAGAIDNITRPKQLARQMALPLGRHFLYHAYARFRM